MKAGQRVGLAGIVWPAARDEAAPRAWCGAGRGQLATTGTQWLLRVRYVHGIPAQEAAGRTL